MTKPENALQVPKNMQARFDEVTAITDRVCRESLDEEYAVLCRKAAAALSRKRPSPLVSGTAATWAAGLAHAMGRVNFLSDKTTQPYMRMADLAKAFSVSQASMSNKATEIWHALDLMPMHPDYCLPSLVDDNPLVWMLSVNGIFVDIRTMPLSAQLEAFRLGFIPYIPSLKDVPADQQFDKVAALLKEEGAVIFDEAPPSQIYQIKITLDDLKPAIWRRVEVPDNYTLGDLHYVIQIAMGWGDAHLHEFVVNRQHYTPLDDDLAFDSPTDDEDEDSVILADVIKKKGQKFKYTYDFGDSWEHTLLVEKVLPVDADRFYPVCTGGEYACPPEDVGSIPGFMRFLEAMRNVDDPEHDEYKEWYGADFDPVAFDLEAVNSRLRTTFGEETA